MWGIMNIKDKHIDKIKKQIRNAADKKYTNKLNVSAPSSDGLPLMNSRCQFNAVHSVKSGVSVAVIECVMIEDAGCVAHYVNLLADGSIVDFTLGWSWSGRDYRLVRYVHENEYYEINNSLGKLKETLCAGFIGKFCKLLSIDKWDLC